MNKLMDRLQKYLLPLAIKIGNLKFLVALRDAFIGTMPVVMTGSLAILFNAFLVDIPDQFNLPAITANMQWLVDINNLVFKGSLAIVTLMFVVSLGVNVAKIYQVDRLSAALVTLSSFVISLGQSMSTTFAVSADKISPLKKLLQGVDGLSVGKDGLTATISGMIPAGQITSNG